MKAMNKLIIYQLKIMLMLMTVIFFTGNSHLSVYAHEHTYSATYIDNGTHQLSCECGATSVADCDLVDIGNNWIECSVCGYKIYNDINNLSTNSVIIQDVEYMIENAVDGGNHNGLIWYVFDATPDNSEHNAFLLYIGGSNTEGPAYTSKVNEKVIYPWSDYLADIIAVSCDAVLYGDMTKFFAGLSTASMLECGPNFNVSNVTNMSLMFASSGFTTLDLSTWDVSNVTSMLGMFNNCTKLVSLDITGWDTSKVKSMANMFYLTGKLKNVDLTQLDLDNCHQINSMFFQSGIGDALKGIENWNVSSVENFSSMFGYMAYFPSVLDLSNWDMSNASYIVGMFASIRTSNVTINVSNWNMPKVTSFYTLFGAGTAYTSSFVKNIIGLETWDTSNVTDMRSVFYGTSNLTSLDLSNWDTSKVTNMSHMFDNCTGLKSLNISTWDTSSVTNMAYMFQYCVALNNLDLSKWNTSNVTDMGYMFYLCGSLQSLDVSTWNTSKVTNMKLMFYGCQSLQSLDISYFNTEGVTNMYGMFAYCASLKSLDISNFNMTNVTNTSMMFVDNISLQELILPDTVPVIGSNFMSGIFNLERIQGCNHFTSINDSAFFIYYNNTDKKYLNPEESFALLTEKAQTIFGTEWRNRLKYKTLEDGTKVPFLCIDVQSETLRNGYNWEQAFIYPYEKPKTSVIICGEEYEISSAIDGGNHNGLIWYIFDSTPEDDTDTLYDLYIEGSNTEGPAYTSDSTSSNFYYPWEPYKSNIRYIECDARFKGNITSIFDGMKNATQIHFGTNFHTSYVTSMRKMFRNCQKLSSIDVSNWDISNVTDMGYMFDECSVTSLDVSKWNTSQVSNMSWLFDGCSSLTELDVSKWNTSNVTNMRAMFNNCSSLTTLDVSNWNTSKVTDMGNMFTKTSKLTNIDISNFDVSNVTNMYGMFQQTNMGDNLKGIENWNVSKVKQFQYTFAYLITGPSKLDLSKWDVSSATNVTYMFYSMRTKVKITIDVTGWNMPNITSFYAMFAGRDSTNNVSKISQIIGLETWDTSNITDMSYMFRNCPSLQSLDLSNWNTSNVTNMKSMFDKCIKLTNLDVSKWNTCNVKDMSFMFYGCASLTEINVSNWNTSNVTNMQGMFYGCSKLTTLEVSKWDISNVKDMSCMFYDCPELTSLNVADWDTSNVTNMRGMFYGCQSLLSLDVSNWNTSKIINMMYMFYNCASITEIDLSNWDTPNVTNMNHMFGAMFQLKSLNISNFDMTNVIDTDYIFYGVISLQELILPDNIPVLGHSFITDMYNLKSLKGCHSFTSMQPDTFVLAYSSSKDKYYDAEENFALWTALYQAKIGTEWRNRLKYKTTDEGTKIPYLYINVESEALRNGYDWKRAYLTTTWSDYVVSLPVKVYLDFTWDETPHYEQQFDIVVEEDAFFASEELPCIVTLPAIVDMKTANNQSYHFDIAQKSTSSMIQNDRKYSTFVYSISGEYVQGRQELNGNFTVSISE